MILKWYQGDYEDVYIAGSSTKCEVEVKLVAEFFVLSLVIKNVDTYFLGLPAFCSAVSQSEEAIKLE